MSAPSRVHWVPHKQIAKDVGAKWLHGAGIRLNQGVWWRDWEDPVSGVVDPEVGARLVAKGWAKEEGGGYLLTEAGYRRVRGHAEQE